MNSDDSRQLEQGLFIRRVIIVIGLTGLAVLLWQLREMLLLVFGAVVVAAIFRALAGSLHRRLPLTESSTMGVLPDPAQG